MNMQATSDLQQRWVPHATSNCMPPSPFAHRLSADNKSVLVLEVREVQAKTMGAGMQSQSPCLSALLSRAYSSPIKRRGAPCRLRADQPTGGLIACIPCVLDCRPAPGGTHLRLQCPSPSPASSATPCSTGVCSATASAAWG